MLTKEEIKALPIPEITKEIKAVAWKKGSKRYNHMVKNICVTHELISGVDTFNFFYADQEGNVALRYRFFLERDAVMTQDFTKTPKGAIKKTHVINTFDKNRVYYNL